MPLIRVDAQVLAHRAAEGAARMLSPDLTGSLRATGSVDRDADVACADTAAGALAADLADAIAASPPHAPVVIMIHGYRFSPADPRFSPHDHILSLDPAPRTRRAMSWPRHLGFAGPDAGLAIAFGWESRGSIWGAHRRAGTAGAALADLIGTVRRLAPGRPVHLIAHSLGARVALCALPLLPAGAVNRIILMAAAEFRARAERVMDSPAGRSAEVINITSRENDMFDFCMEMLMGAGLFPVLGHGLYKPRPNWLDVQIDDPASIAALVRIGFAIGAPAARICHWSPYLRPGLFGFYRALLANPAGTPMDALRTCLPSAQTRRWSRLFALPRLTPVLPGLRKAS